MKKKMFLILMLSMFVFGISNVSALDIASCNNAIKGVIIDEKIPNIVSTAITVIKIVVPVLLVIFGMLDLMKGITAQKEDEIAKGRKIFVKRLISGALVFFVFTIVQLIVSFVADDNDKKNIMTCTKCFLNGDCTYRKVNGSCPSGTEPNDNNSACIKVI